MKQAGCSGRQLACALFSVEAQSARWCVGVTMWSGHAQQRTLLWLGHLPLGKDMVCPLRLDVACHIYKLSPRLFRVLYTPWLASGSVNKFHITCCQFQYIASCAFAPRISW